MRMKMKRGTALTLALLGATALNGLSNGYAMAAQPSPLDETAAVQANFTPVGDFTNLVKRVTPAVVSIDVHLKLNPADGQDSSGDQMQGGMPQIPGFPPGFPFGGMPGFQAQPQVVEAKGSGFIIASSGIVVTNNHVVKDAKTVSVELSDGRKYPAKILGTDPKTDLAVLKIDAGHPLPYVELGDSAGVEPGEWVVAMGNPFGLGGTVTAGIVSALGRDIGDGPYDKFIQIDAPINEGNSGGPLFNQHGQVIGINTAILTPTGGSVGIGFAIPSDMIKRVTGQLIASGKVVRGYLGVAAQEISPQVAQAMGLGTADPAHDGALVAAVSAGSPAAKAGLQPGDVITKVDGAVVANPNDLADDIANVVPGHSTAISFIRDGKAHEISVPVEVMPANPDAGFQQGGSGQTGQAATQGDLGLTLAPLTPDLRSQLNLPGNAAGAVVMAVKPNSPADQAGLQQGDLLVGVGPQNVTSPGDVVADIEAARKSGAKAVALRIIRQGQALFVGISLGKNSGASQN
ncbi:trypsin-like peptidase domain-containing protein [Acidocella sp.]|uniref:trypsin-like peptidase domain-containing protein n=1 Tax=Acidocella sp. TaxID=50710 RepID=UPI0017B14DEC|nr:trypsin-like peptidase domain-containing protein [Acidocella sp.]NNM56847.1 PDZ domain-containing protein [Acidocella sp.]